MVRSSRLWFLMILIFAAAGLANILDFPKTQASGTQSSWLKAEPPTIKAIDSDLSSELLPIYPNRDCLPNTTFITRPKNIIKGISGSTIEVCSVQTAFGQKSTGSGYVKLNDTDIAGPVKSSSGGSLTTMAIPRSSHIMYPGSGFYGTSWSILRDFALSSNIVVQPDGSISHRLKPNVSGHQIKDSRGTTLEFKDLRFSDNGKWMVSDVPFRGMTRVDIESGQTLMFGDGYDHSVGIKPNFVNAVSGDGRYVMTAENIYDILKLYDLSTCQNTSDPVRQSCSYKNLLPQIRRLVPGFKKIYHAQFSTNYSLRLYIQYSGSDGRDRYGYYLLTAPGEKESSLNYLALGDSFASGEGAFNYRGGTDIERPFNKCHLSNLSYPYLLSLKSVIGSTQSVACSGAKLKDIVFEGEEPDYNHHHKQSEGKQDSKFDSEIYRDYLTGYRPQVSFIKNTKPQIITLSISGNDIGFGKILFSCLMPGTCYDTPQEKLNLKYTINSKFDSLVSAYSRVKEEAGTGSKIYVLGYPSLADPNGNCALNVHLNKQEIIFSNQIINDLNSVVEQAAYRAGVLYIDVEDIFKGHRLCETASSNSAVHGLTAGNDKTFSIPLKLTNQTIDVYLTGRESYHPNQLGHRLYAEAIWKATNGFSRISPEAQPNISLPSLENPNNLSPRKIVFKDNLTDDIVPASQSINIRDDNLLPSSNVAVYASATFIGNAPIDSSGRFSANFALPASLRYGVHTIRMHAKNSAGEDLELQKLVYVAAESDDLDGDNIPNHQEKCLIVDKSGVDEDQDSIDDACDDQFYSSDSSSTSLGSAAEKNPTIDSFIENDPETPSKASDQIHTDSYSESAAESSLTGKSLGRKIRSLSHKNSLHVVTVIVVFLSLIYLVLRRRMARKSSA